MSSNNQVLDAATTLEQCITDLSNLPAELQHVLEEIGETDLKFYDTRKRIQQRDNQIHKFIKANGSLAENPKEQQAYPKMRADFEKASQLQQQKMDWAVTGLYVMTKNMKRLNEEIGKLEEEGLILPLDENGEDVVMEDTPPAPPAKSRSRISSVSDTKRNSPAVGSRGNTPGAAGGGSRSTKRMKVAAGDVSNASTPPAVTTPTGAPATANTYARPTHHQTVIADEEEQLYCTCQQVSFGNMVGCDNPDCQYEWFHYECVGLTAPPSGTWYCPTCSKERKEKDFKEPTIKRKRG